MWEQHLTYIYLSKGQKINMCIYMHCNRFMAVGMKFYIFFILL